MSVQDTTTAGNGTTTTPPRELRGGSPVRYGDQPHEVLRLDVTENVLRLWHQAEPERMAAYVAAAMFGTEVAPAGRPGRR
jgi:hypothetical protein